MGAEKKTETRSFVTSVKIGNYRNGLRLRWTYGNKRQELYLPTSCSKALLISQNIKHVIEQDIAGAAYDETLNRYKLLLQDAALGELVKKQLYSTFPVFGKTQSQAAVVYTSEEIIQAFDQYLVIKDKVNDPNYYALTRKSLVKWGQFVLDDVPMLLSKENWSAKTFNDRRNCLNAFFDYLKRKKRIVDNPLDDLSTRERNRMHEDRQPFTEKEAAAILHAFQTNRFVKKSSRFDHATYYPLVALLLHIGCRPSEALGLKVKYVKFEEGHLTIGNALARTVKGTHSSARVYKSTKNMKVRHIPLDEYLVELLTPLCKGKGPDDYVFLNQNGNVIDDKQFLRRVFKPIQAALKIPYRVTYACRHTFATRAVKQGMKPHEVAYLMGDSLETVLQNYFHNNCMPERLPRRLAQHVETM
jgi:integrase